MEQPTAPKLNADMANNALRLLDRVQTQGFTEAQVMLALGQALSAIAEGHMKVVPAEPGDVTPTGGGNRKERRAAASAKKGGANGAEAPAAPAT